MIQALTTATSTEVDAAILQAAVTFGIGGYSAFLYRRYRKPWFLWFAVAWSLYLLRLAAIVAFLLTARQGWLYWHQVVTGWTALALLWAALVFSRQLAFRPRYAVALLFPLGWSFIAIYLLESFVFAALPAVLFLSGVTAWTGWIFLDYWRRVRSPGAGLLAASLMLWALHHLDYPWLRARGAWSPWGYYLDIALLLVTAASLTVLVLDDLRRGFEALTELATGGPGGTRDARLTNRDVVDTLLERASRLPAARGAALYRQERGVLEFTRGVGACADWGGRALGAEAERRTQSVIASRAPAVYSDWPAPDNRRYAFTAILPITGDITPPSALVVTGDTRDPFAALDATFLVALSAHLGSALDGDELTRRLRERTDDLTRLSTRMIQHHEVERKRLSRELHDETAQVFTALKLQLGLLRERADPAGAAELERALALVDKGMGSIRSVTETLRPAVLDELGLLPALRSIADDFASRSGLDVTVEMPPRLPRTAPDAELALYRAMQESLTNVLRHADARTVRVTLEASAAGLALAVEDDGRGIDPGMSPGDFEQEGRMGLAGMRDRVAALGGSLGIGRGGAGGTVVRVAVPAAGAAR